jgi:hypothetical protein
MCKVREFLVYLVPCLDIWHHYIAVVSKIRENPRYKVRNNSTNQEITVITISNIIQ